MMKYEQQSSKGLFSKVVQMAQELRQSEKNAMKAAGLPLPTHSAPETKQ